MIIRTIRPLVGVAFLCLLISCKIEPQPIAYGSDQCDFCLMNIVDKTHSAQLVTSKGKQFKFDAIECLVNHLQTVNEEDMAFVLIADFNRPGVMINAESSTFLISEQIKSPMGANLSGLSSIKEAKSLQNEHTGEIFSWSELKEQLKDK